MGRKTYEVTGYACDGQIYCPRCFEDVKYSISVEHHIDQISPVFLSEEWDYQPTCDICNEPIDVTVIDYEPIGSAGAGGEGRPLTQTGLMFSKQEPLKWYKELYPSAKVKRIRYAVATVDIGRVVMWFHHKTPIAEYNRQYHVLYIDPHGWYTRTTKDNINRILSHYGVDCSISQHNYEWYCHFSRGKEKLSGGLIFHGVDEPQGVFND